MFLLSVAALIKIFSSKLYSLHNSPNTLLSKAPADTACSANKTLSFQGCEEFNATIRLPEGLNLNLCLSSCSPGNTAINISK